MGGRAEARLYGVLYPTAVDSVASKMSDFTR